MMLRQFAALALVTGLVAGPALAQDKAKEKAPPAKAAPPKAKAPPKNEVKAGAEFAAKIKEVDAKAGTLTVTVDDKELTFKVTADTEIVGPLGGKVPKRLKDERFVKDFGVKITPADDTDSAAKIVLGTRGKAPADKPKMEKKPV